MRSRMCPTVISVRETVRFHSCTIRPELLWTHVCRYSSYCDTGCRLSVGGFGLRHQLSHRFPRANVLGTGYHVPQYQVCTFIIKFRPERARISLYTACGKGSGTSRTISLGIWHLPNRQSLRYIRLTYYRAGVAWCIKYQQVFFRWKLVGFQSQPWMNQSDNSQTVPTSKPFLGPSLEGC